MLIIFCGMGFSSCEDDECLKGSGDFSRETRQITEAFSSIEINDNLNVDIYIDGSNYLEIEGGENVISHVKSYVAEKTLKLENNNSCNFLRNFDQDLKLKLHLKTLSSLYYNGSGTVVMKDTAKVDQFYFFADQGTGSLRLLVKCHRIDASLKGGLTDIELIGDAYTSFIYLSESCVVNSKAFITEVSDIYNESTGDCTVNATVRLNGYILRIGNIVYLGHPDIHYYITTGEGKFMPYSP